ncbi:hypothetical protein BKA69DRAFT_1078499 [Paraphysoderma sedebokerense]|nr:hypothetical protein BKA69DRAFT_1078499 [Paraphysoderma sedebokerense]
MYSRSERKFLEPNKSTNPNLGPGSYTIDETLITPKPIKRSTTPFSNVSDRKTIFDDLAKSAAPPPGAYNIELFDIQKTAKSVSFGKSNINRFEQPQSSTPGPGTYYNTELSTLRPHTHDGRLTIPESGLNVQSIIAKPSTADPTLFSVQASKKPKIIWKRKHLPPSIPYRSHSNGYVENDDGDIVPRQVEKSDNSIGPAYYNIETSLPYKRRNGTDFSKSRTERCIIKPSSSPGPGAYDVAKASKALLDNKPVNESTPSTPTMRFGDIVMNEAAKHNLPGPGSYVVPSMLNNKNRGASFAKCVGRIENASTNPFGIVKTLQDDNPGPGAYNGPSESKQRKPTRLAPQPFDSSAKRFTGFKSNITNNLPAPNSYNPGDATIYGPKKPLRRSKSYAFGLKSERFCYSKNSENTSPGPAVYDNSIKRSSKKSKSKNRYRKSARQYNIGSDSLQPTPAFGTQTSRFLEGPEKETPPPNAYDVLHAYDALQSKGKVAAIRRTASAPSLSNKSGHDSTAAARKLQ